MLSQFLKAVASKVEDGAETVWHWIQKQGPMARQVEAMTIDGALALVKLEFPLLPLPSSDQVQTWFGALTKAQTPADAGQATVQLVKGYIGTPAAVSDVKTALEGVCNSVLAGSPWSAEARTALDALVSKLVTPAPAAQLSGAAGSTSAPVVGSGG